MTEQEAVEEVQAVEQAPPIQIDPIQIDPIQEDYNELFRQNPLAQQQLHKIMLSRKVSELAAENAQLKAEAGPNKRKPNRAQRRKVVRKPAAKK